MFGRKHDLGSGERCRTSSRAPQDRELARLWRILGAANFLCFRRSPTDISYPLLTGPHRARRSLLLMRKYVTLNVHSPQSDFVSYSRVVLSHHLPKQNKKVPSRPRQVLGLTVCCPTTGPVTILSDTFADRRDLAVAYSLAERCEFPKEIPSEHHTLPMTRSDPDFFSELRWFYQEGASYLFPDLW